MFEFWALIGLACLDRVFLEQLVAHKNNVEAVVKEYGFRLSRWEMAELTRVLQLGEVTHHMHMICEGAWDNAFVPKDEKPCWWSAHQSQHHDDPKAPPYEHPLANGQPVPKHPGGGDREEQTETDHSHA